MNAQLNLFEQDQIYRRQYRDYLRSGQWQLAEVSYRKWLKLSATDETLPKVKALSELFDHLARRVSPVELAETQKSINSNEEAFLFREELPYLRQGISLRITQMVPETQFEFLTDGYHPAQAYMDCGKYSQAEKILSQALGKSEPQSLIRQLLGYVYYIQGKIERAETEMTLSVFSDSRTINPNYIYPESFRKKYYYLHDTLQQKYLTNSVFPFYLWKKGLSRLNPDDRLFSESIYTRIEQKPDLFKDSAERLYYFTLLLAGAELIRIKNPRKFTNDHLRSLQKSMQICHPEYFQEYLTVLENFNH